MEGLQILEKVIRTRKGRSLCADKYRKKKDVRSLLKVDLRTNARKPVWQTLVRTALIYSVLVIAFSSLKDYLYTKSVRPSYVMVLTIRRLS